MKKVKGRSTLIIAIGALCSGLVQAEGQPPEAKIEIEPRLTCVQLVQWQKLDVSRRHSCLGLDLGFPLGLNTSFRVTTGVQLTGAGIRYRFDEDAFTEVRVDLASLKRRQGKFFSIFLNLKY